MRLSFAGFSNGACTRRGAWLGASPPEHCAPLRARSGGMGARTGIRFARKMHGLCVKGIKLTK